MKQIFTFVFIMVLTSAAHAGQVSKPHEFSAGTAAVADEVNQNFDAIVNEVNDNDVRLQQLEQQVNTPTYQYSSVLGQLTSPALNTAMEIVDVKINYARVVDNQSSTALFSKIDLIVRDGPGFPGLMQNLTSMDPVQYVLELTEITLTLNDTFVESIHHIGRERELPGQGYAPNGESGLIAISIAGVIPQLRNNNSNNTNCSRMNFVYGYPALAMPAGTSDHQPIYKYEFNAVLGWDPVSGAIAGANYSPFLFTMPVSTDGSEACLLDLILNTSQVDQIDLAFVDTGGNLIADKLMTLQNARPESMLISASNTGELFITVGYAYEGVIGQYDSNNSFRWETGSLSGAP